MTFAMMKTCIELIRIICLPEQWSGKKIHSLLLDRTQDQWFITHGFVYLGCLKTLSLMYFCPSSLSPVTFTNVL